MRLRSGFQLTLCRYDAPVEADREETVPAWSATIGGKLKQTEQPGKRASSMLAGNPLEIHVAAQSTMRIPDERDGDRPSIKSLIATPATPGPQQSDADEVVFHTPSARTTRTVAEAYGADQICFSLRGSAKSIREGQLTRQVPSCCLLIRRVQSCWRAPRFMRNIQRKSRARILSRRAASTSRTGERMR